MGVLSDARAPLAADAASPVRILARLVMQIAVVANELVNLTPLLASESILGVCNIAFPAHPRESAR